MSDQRPMQYGTSMHYPYCIDGRCTGCLPPVDLPTSNEPKLDLSLFRPQLAEYHAHRRRMNLLICG